MTVLRRTHRCSDGESADADAVPRLLSAGAWAAVLLLGCAVTGPRAGRPVIRRCRSAHGAPAPCRPCARRRARAVAAAPKEWTGESGSSGHPLMQASAIRAAAANFESCVEGLWPLAAKRNISRASFDKYTKGLTPDLRIMDLMDAQPEFTKAFWDYLDILVSDARIAGGRDILAKNKAVFDKVEKQYGVDRHIITAIWGVEFELRHARRRPPGAALDRDARLRRPPPGVFPRRVSLRAGNPASRRPEAGATDRLLGRRVRTDAVHADVVQALRRRFRRRRPPRCRQQPRRPDRLDRQQSEEGRLGAGRDLGLRGRRPEGLQLPAGRSQQAAHASPNGKRTASSAPAASRSRIRTRRPICWCRPATRGRAS